VIKNNTNRGGGKNSSSRSLGLGGEKGKKKEGIRHIEKSSVFERIFCGATGSREKKQQITKKKREVKATDGLGGG